jgi:hypothetical protein
VVSELAVASPGAFDEWLLEQGVPAIVYEVEHAGLPQLCKRHLPGLERLLRGEVVSARAAGVRESL